MSTSHRPSAETSRAAAPSPPRREVSAAGSGACSPRAARVLYNALDAWFPPTADELGAGDFDLLEPTLRELRPAHRRGLEAMFVLLDWIPCLTLRFRGYSALPRAERRRWLARFEAWSPPPLRRRLGALRRVAAAAYRDALAEHRAQRSSPDP